MHIMLIIAQDVFFFLLGGLSFWGLLPLLLNFHDHHDDDRSDDDRRA